MRVIVTGNRDYPSRELVWEWLAKLPREHLVVVHGGCPTGADKAADEWAVMNARPEPVIVDREWESSVNRRSDEMVNRGAKIALAFWDGTDPPTAYAIIRCVKAGIPVRIVPWPKKVVAG